MIRRTYYAGKNAIRHILRRTHQPTTYRRKVRFNRFQNNYNRKDKVAFHRPRAKNPRIATDIKRYVRSLSHRAVPQEVRSIKNAMCKLKRRQIRRDYFGYRSTGRRATGASGTRFSMPLKCRRK